MQSLLKSQPPRGEDIPAMVSFVQVFGGLPSGVFVKNLAHMVRHFMPSGRIVPGAFFTNIADISKKIGTNSQPAHLVNAMLLCHACSFWEQDGFARFITKGDISQISAPKNKHTVAEGNGVLGRAMGLMDFNIDTNDTLKLYLDLCFNIVDVVCKRGKVDADGKDLTISSVAQAFSQSSTLGPIQDEKEKKTAR